MLKMEVSVIVMKRNIAFLFLFFYAGVQLYGQNDSLAFIPISNQGRWYINDYEIFADGDTVINGKEYVKIYYDCTPYPPAYLCAVRSDTAAQKVFGVYGYVYDDDLDLASYVIDIKGNRLFDISDTTELLLYDFSLQTGDSVTFYVFARYGLVWGSIMQEKGIIVEPELAGDSVTVTSDNVLHRNFFVQLDWRFPKICKWIDGIGSRFGLFQDALFQPVVERNCSNGPEEWTALLCYEENGVNILKTNLDTDGDPEDCYAKWAPEDKMWGIDEQSLPDIKIYPNPTSDYIRIDCPESYVSGNMKVELYSILGDKLISKDITDPSSTLFLNNMPAGMYIVRITRNSSPVYQYKISKF